MTVPLSLSGEIFPTSNVYNAVLHGSGADVYISRGLFIEGELTEIVIGADNPAGTITPFGYLTYITDIAPRTFEGQILLTGQLASMQVFEAGCFTDTTYECVDATEPSFTCIGACEVQQPIVNPEISLAGVILPVGQMIQLPALLELLSGTIAPVGAVSGSIGGVPQDNLFIWLKSYVETPPTEIIGGTERFISGGYWIDQAKPEENALLIPNGSSTMPELVADAINGVPSVKFSSAAAFTWINNDRAPLTEGHLFLLMRMNHGITAPSASGWINYGCATGPSWYPYADGKAYMEYCTTVRKILTWSISWGSQDWHVCEFQSKAGRWKFLINGTEFYSTATNTFCTINGVGSGVTFGGLISFGGHWELIELMEYSRVITDDSQAQAVRDYLYSVIGISP